MNALTAAKCYFRFVRGLPRFLRTPITVEEAYAVIRRRIEERDKNFLLSLERGVYGRPDSPYRALLEIAGCELGDIRQMVQDGGVDPTLRDLREAGVYVTFEEFKGIQPIVRGGRVIETKPEDFDNPQFSRSFQVSTGGTTGKGRKVMVDLESMAARLPQRVVTDDIYGQIGVPSAVWFSPMPGHGTGSVVSRAVYGNLPERWFTPVTASDLRPSLRYRLANGIIVEVARLSGAKVPRPERLPLDQAGVIAQWAADALRTHGRCTVSAFVSQALRVCVAAEEMGLDLTGATIWGGGEAPTEAKVRAIESTGARFFSNYFFSEAGAIGMPCLDSEDPNDHHLQRDHLALIQHPRQVPGFDVTVDAFYFTTLLPTATKMLLNVESDDCGVVERRACGCPWHALGFTEHVREIRSFRKLTGEGVTLLGSEMEEILETVLPARFGGTALDYQLLEEEDERGFTRLSLVVSPKVELESERAAIDAVLEGLQRSGTAAEVCQAIWSQADTFRVKRMEPIWTARGKLVPLHMSTRRGGTAAGSEAGVA